MSKTASIHARIEPEIKVASEKVLKKIGLSATDAICLLYRQIALRKEFPLELKIPNKLTIETLDKSQKNQDIEHFDNLDDMYKSWQD